MMSDIEREEFEQWAKESGYALLKTGLNDYFYKDTGAAWDAWQAVLSRGNAQAEDLPNCDNCGQTMDYMPWHYSMGEERHLHACDQCWQTVGRSVSVPDDDYIRALQDAFEIIQADANTEQNYESLCRIGGVLAELQGTGQGEQAVSVPEPPKQMEISKFLKTVHSELKLFSLFWKDKNTKGIEKFPATLTEEEWLENLIDWFSWKLEDGW